MCLCASIDAVSYFRSSTDFPAQVDCLAVERRCAQGKRRACGKPTHSNVRRNRRRSDETVARLLDATEAVVLRDGSERIFVIDLCALSGVSRGTFYRYFLSQDALLDPYACFKRESFLQSMLVATSKERDPDARFRALVRLLEAYVEQGHARSLLKVAPEYTLPYLQRIFNDAQVQLLDALQTTFEAWETRRGGDIDRELICEVLVRYVLSQHLAPHEEARESAERIERFVRALAGNPVRGVRRGERQAATT